jgi:hypothetical protein
MCVHYLCAYLCCQSVLSACAQCVRVHACARVFDIWIIVFVAAHEHPPSRSRQSVQQRTIQVRLCAKCLVALMWCDNLGSKWSLSQSSSGLAVSVVPRRCSCCLRAFRPMRVRQINQSHPFSSCSNLREKLRQSYDGHSNIVSVSRGSLAL